VNEKGAAYETDSITPAQRQQRAFRGDMQLGKQCMEMRKISMQRPDCEALER